MKPYVVTVLKCMGIYKLVWPICNDSGRILQLFVAFHAYILACFSKCLRVLFGFIYDMHGYNLLFSLDFDLITAYVVFCSFGPLF
jgi:hypothetical protein